MSILVLKKSDFSKNYIRKINIFTDFTTQAKQVFTMYGITPNSNNALHIAVNNFIDTLYINGMWGTSIKGICLPFMSELSKGGDLAYAQINAIDGANFFTENITGRLSLTEHGLKPIQGSTVAIIDSSNISDGTLHYAAYNMTSNVDTMSSTKIAGDYAITGGLSGVALLRNGGGSHLNPGYFLTSSIYTFGGNDVESQIFNIGTYRNDHYGVLYSKGIKYTTSSSVDLTDNIPIIFGCGSILSTYTDIIDRSNGYYTKNSYGILSVGTSLTDEECVIFNNAVNNLMEKVKMYFA